MLNKNNALFQASRATVGKHLVGLIDGEARDRSWLTSENRYRTDVVGQLSNEWKAQSHDVSALADYCAASAILHCSDGWSYLGRALDCALHGDDRTSTHLAYYAELRAVMSVLASEGVLIGDKQHMVVTEDGVRHLEGGRTHAAAWKHYEDWATSERALDLVGRVVRPGGIEIRAWMDRFYDASVFGSTATPLLRAWGLDVERMRADETARNEATYRPARLIHGTWGVDIVVILQCVRDIWLFSQPSGPATFAQLDRQLLRQCLRLPVSNKCPEKASEEEGPGYEERVEIMLAGLSLDGAAAEEWRTFLSPNAPMSPVLSLALGQASFGSREHLPQALSRATLLLRIATGSAAALLSDGGIDSADLRFWWAALGEAVGLWEKRLVPDSCADLWDDVSSSLEAICDEPDVCSSVFLWRRKHAQANSLLTECERIALWSLCP